MLRTRRCRTTFALSSGTYTLTVVTFKDTDRGIMTVAIDGTSVGTLDTYDTQAVLIDSTLTGLAVTSTAVHTLKITMATKNASSSSYVGVINALHLTRTA